MYLRQVLSVIVLWGSAIGLSAAAAAVDPNTAVDPTELTPMTVGVALSTATAKPGDTVAVIGTVRLLPGWYTYASVPAGKPYIQTKWSIDPSPAVTPQGDWMNPTAIRDTRDPTLTVYKGNKLTFMRQLKVANTASGSQTVRVNILFQTCNIEHCLAPTRKSFNLKLAVAPAKSK